MLIIGSLRTQIFSLKNSNFDKSLKVSIVGHVILSIFFTANFHSNFLKNVIFGRPEILNINLVLKFLKINKTRGRDVIKCTIRKFGFFSCRTFISGNKDLKKI